MRTIYPNDITREQFDKICPLLESVRKKTKSRTIDLYDVFCAVLYVLKTGCKWRMLPNDFPKWNTVYAYFQKWGKCNNHKISILDQALEQINFHKT